MKLVIAAVLILTARAIINEIGSYADETNPFNNKREP
jgi:hypothetical protein